MPNYDFVENPYPVTPMEKKTTRPSLESKNFIKSIKESITYKKQALTERANLASKIIQDAKVPDFPRNILQPQKTLGAFTRGAMGAVDISGDKNWREEAINSRGSNHPENTANSTPVFHPDTGHKFDVLSNYNFDPSFVNGLMKSKIEQVGPTFSKDNNTVYIKREGLGYNRGKDLDAWGGNYDDRTDVSETNSDPNVTAHEFLHRAFRKQEVLAGVEWQKFNRDWENMLRSSSENFNIDPAVAKEMQETEALMDNSSLYRGIRKRSEQELANERFAYLGMMIGRKDFNGRLPESLKKYYRSIFTNIK